MKLSKNMNFIELGRYIIAKQKSGVDQATLNSELRKALGWSERQAFSATDVYFGVDNLGDTSGAKVNRK